MVPFIDVVNNWGDFGRRVENPFKSNFGGAREGLNGDRTISFDPISGNAYADPGEGRPWERFRSLDRQRKRLYEADMFQAAKLIKRAFDGDDLARIYMKRAMHGGFKEALSISDFPNLFGDVIDRAVLANYIETPYTWNMIAHAAEVSDFRPVRRFRIDGGTGLLGNTLNSSSGLDASGNLIPIEQGAQYPEDSLSDAQYTYRLQKQGKRMPFFWETFVNDDLNALKDTPARFGRGARRTEEYFVTKLFANNTSFFKAGAGFNNIVTNAVLGDSGGNNPALSITALQRAIIVMMQQVDTTGQPISVEAMTLVVPPSLKTIAMNILNTDYVWMGDQGGTNGGANTFPLQQLHAMNWAKNIVRLAVNYYLPIIDTVNGKTGWYLFANPESGRPALEFGRLRGHVTPELFMKLPNSVAIGEGSMGPGPGSIPGTTNMNPMEGDFDTDSVHYKVRQVLGGTTIDPIMAVFSNGSGT